MKGNHVFFAFRLDKDQFTEDEKNDAQEEKKRLAEEARVVRERLVSSRLSVMMIDSF